MRCLALFYDRDFTKLRVELPVVMGLFSPLLRNAASCPSGGRGPLAAPFDFRLFPANSILKSPRVYDTICALEEIGCFAMESIKTEFRRNVTYKRTEWCAPGLCCNEAPPNKPATRLRAIRVPSRAN